jgi:hypothetical protein
VAFDIFEKKSDVHEQIEAVAFFYLVVLLRWNHEYFVFGVLGGQDIHLSVIEWGFDDVKFEGRQGG